MDSHDSYHQTPPGMNMNMNMNMMMPPSFNHHMSNDNKNVNLISSSPRFPYSSGGDQFSSGDGSLQSGGFLGGGYSLEPAKKKRGRPRKYSPVGDGGNVALGLSPGPNVAVSGVGGGNLESSNVGTTNADVNVNVDLSVRKRKGRPAGSGKRQLDALGAAGVGFTPHVIIVKAGEDIASTLMSFSKQGPRIICILSANGSICNVTLRQPASSGGTVTYEGRFEIISLSGSFMHSEESNGNGNHSKPSGLSVSLAGSDGRVLGGGVAGMLVAASPVQVIVGSFIAESKKPKPSVGPSSVASPNMLSFGGGGAVPGVSPPSEGRSTESSDESGSSSLHRIPGSYNNTPQHPQQHQHHQQQQQQQHQQQQQQQQQQHHHQQQQQHQPQQQQQPMQNLPMYSNMGWPPQ